MPETVKISKKVLVAPLDWGLGHATRCIPVIKKLKAFSCEVWIAASGPSSNLLQSEFPELKVLHLEGYGVQYGKNGVLWTLGKQIPAIRKRIKQENKWLKSVQEEHHFDGIISDNRYGLYHPGIPSVLITHQLNLQVPSFLFFLKPAIRNYLYALIRHFDACWIPDISNREDSLAGELSHPEKVPDVKTQYIGWLSRFSKPEKEVPKNNSIFISLSGPEPQRSIFENLVWEQLPGCQWPVVIVRGLPGTTEIREAPPTVQVYNHLPSKEMHHIMSTCSLMICRGGYSSLMDAQALNTPVACVPTPGQTEQEYLAKRMFQQGIAFYQKQSQFNLKDMIQNSRLPFFSKGNVSGNLLDGIIRDWVSSL